MKNSGQEKRGVIFSYLLIIANTFSGLILTPYIVTKLGMDDYGVYKIVASLSSSLMVLDLGVGTTVLRYISKYRADGQEDKIGNYLAMNYILTGVMECIVILISVVFYFCIPAIYNSSLSDTQLQLAQRLFVLLAINMCLHIFANVQNGVIGGFGDFSVSNGIKLGRVLIRFVLMFIVLAIIPDATVFVVVDLFITLLSVLAQNIYISRRLKVKVKLVKWVGSVFKESFVYTIFMFVQSIINQINSNVDTLVIGAIVSAAAVTIYSYGLQLFSMFNQIGVSISSVILPRMTELIKKDPSPRRLEDEVIKIGRYQFMLLGAAVLGFWVIGKEFIQLWLGDQYSDVWIIGMILMVPSLFELIQNVCISILRVKNYMVFRTITLSITALGNFLLTIVLVRQFGYVAASYGTAISLIVSNIVIMDIYYKVKLNLNLIRINIQIFHGIFPCQIIATFVTYFVSKLFGFSWIDFIFEVVVFIVVYGVALLLFGLRDYERKTLLQVPLSFIKRVLK